MKLKLMMFLSVMMLSSGAQAMLAGYQCWCANSGPGTFVVGPTTSSEMNSLNILSQLGGGTNCACRNASTGSITEYSQVLPGGIAN